MSTTTPPTPSTAVSRPVSEALLNEKARPLHLPTAPISFKRSFTWDRCLSNLLVKSTLGVGFGVVFSVLLFKRRAWPAFVGAGFGAGRAYEECNFNLKQAAKNVKNQS